jgi:hypothetical protein
LRRLVYYFFLFQRVKAAIFNDRQLKLQKAKAEGGMKSYPGYFFNAFVSLEFPDTLYFPAKENE